MKPKTGQIVECEFLDHVEDGGEPLRFIVWGRLAKIGRTHYEIVSWAYADPDIDDVPANEKRWTIVKSAVLNISILKP